MALQSSGQISLNDLHVEVGGTSGTECSMNDSDIRGLIGLSSANQAAMNAFYGASNAQIVDFNYPGTYYSSSSAYPDWVTTSTYTTYYTYAKVVTNDQKTLLGSPPANFDNTALSTNGGSGTSYFHPPQGTLSSNSFNGNTGQKIVGVVYTNHPGGASFRFFVLGGYNTGGNTGFNTITISAYGQGLTSSTVKTWTSTISRSNMNFAADQNQAYQSGSTIYAYAKGWNFYWEAFHSPYSTSNRTAFTGDDYRDVCNAAISSSNSSGMTITWT
jgi:hypothetical protein